MLQKQEQMAAAEQTVSFAFDNAQQSRALRYQREGHSSEFLDSTVRYCQRHRPHKFAAGTVFVQHPHAEHAAPAPEPGVDAWVPPAQGRVTSVACTEVGGDSFRLQYDVEDADGVRTTLLWPSLEWSIRSSPGLAPQPSITYVAQVRARGPAHV